MRKPTHVLLTSLTTCVLSVCALFLQTAPTLASYNSYYYGAPAAESIGDCLPFYASGGAFVGLGVLICGIGFMSGKKNPKCGKMAILLGTLVARRVLCMPAVITCVAARAGSTDTTSPVCFGG